MKFKKYDNTEIDLLSKQDLIDKEKLVEGTFPVALNGSNPFTATYSKRGNTVIFRIDTTVGALNGGGYVFTNSLPFKVSEASGILNMLVGESVVGFARFLALTDGRLYACLPKYASAVTLQASVTTFVLDQIKA